MLHTSKNFVRAGATEAGSQAQILEADMETAVLIADDHVLLAEGVAIALSSGSRHFKSVIAGTLDETLKALKSAQRIDLVLLDIRMPGMIGLSSVEKVISAAAPGQVVLLSGNVDHAFVNAAIAKGARGLIPKTLPLKSLPSVIDFILSGQNFIPSESFDFTKGNSTSSSVDLTSRELQIVQLLSDGQTNKEIAMGFDVTEVTVKMHMRTICRKLNARNRAHVVLISKERGLI